MFRAKILAPNVDASLLVSEPTRILFGLQSNVHFFASGKGYVNLGLRLKTMALLYDEIVLEDGVYDATIGPQLSWQTIKSYTHPDQLKPVRTRKGQTWSLGFAPEASPGGPLAGPVEYMHSTVDKQYRSQFRGVINELAPLNPKWVRVIDFESPAAIQFKRDAAKLAGDWSWNDRSAGIAPPLDDYLRTALAEHLLGDLARSTLMGVHLSPDPAHARHLKSKLTSGLVQPARMGGRPLTMLLPELRGASWADIVELRRDSGLETLRSALREADASAKDEDVRAWILREYEDQLERYQPGWLSGAVNAGVSLLGGAIPLVGTAIGLAQAGSVLAEAAAAQSHWTAALLRVRKQLTQ